MPPWYWPRAYSATSLVIDMADAISMQTVGGPPAPLCELTAYPGFGSLGRPDRSAPVARPACGSID